MDADILPRAAVEAELADCSEIAKRLMVVDPKHEAEHQAINGLLDTWERCER
jgi:hypothetical protein